MAPWFSIHCRARIGLRIVSNLASERLTKASFRLPVAALGYKGFTGQQVADRIVEATEWAHDDPFRAVTHNKGIMNGIDAVAIATGQDWRALEAASHAWASLKPGTQSYTPLTSYRTEQIDGTLTLIGELELPLSVGTKGGVLKTNPIYQVALGLLGNPSSTELAQILASVGLAQNFAALRALCTEGIQKGHMSLHAQNIAIAAGAPRHTIAECVQYMIETGKIHQNGAKEYLDAHKLQGHLVSITSGEISQVSNNPPSMFYFEDLPSPDNDSDEAISLNIAFKTFGDKPLNILFTKEETSMSPTIKSLFGDKSYGWITTVFQGLEKI
ncbi:hypothetical protein HDU91_003901, partial [Kappamyces sp. JEL0680]